MPRAHFGGRGTRREPPPIDQEALADAARERDYFELLGVARSCTADEARAAADALLARIEAAQDEADGWAEVREVVLDARDVLGEDALRSAYRDALGDAAPSPEDTALPVAPSRPE
jgi:hypothetical protein